MSCSPVAVVLCIVLAARAAAGPDAGRCVAMVRGPNEAAALAREAALRGVSLHVLDEGLSESPSGWHRRYVVESTGTWIAGAGTVVEEDPWFEVAAAWPDDPALAAGLQWGLIDIGAPEAWGMTTGRSDLVVALLDTGVDPAHPDLQDAARPGSPRLEALSALGTADVADSLGHGTMVCGVMAARTNNGAGIAGMAGGDGGPSSGPRVLSIKVT